MKIKVVFGTVRMYVGKGAFYIYTPDVDLTSMSLTEEAPKADDQLFSSLFEILKGLLGFRRNLLL